MQTTCKSQSSDVTRRGGTSSKWAAKPSALSHQHYALKLLY
jgi:hypothetical protein